MPLQSLSRPCACTEPASSQACSTSGRSATPIIMVQHRLPPSPQRRALLLGSILWAAGGVGKTPMTAKAALLKPLDNWEGWVQGLFPAAPQPVRFPRKALDLRFAVLLMRSGYDAVDALDFMPMEAFQKEFWKLRAAEQEAYKLQYSPLTPRIGDLTDPLYFDYITFAQYATIAREMPRGMQQFMERQGDVEAPETRLVQRDPRLSDNALLPAAFLDRVGDFIYDGLLNGFRGEQFGAPSPLPVGAPLSDIAANIQKLLDIMVDRGFALKATVSDVTSGTPATFNVRLTGAANLWGLAALNYRRAPIANTYDVALISAYLRACGRSGKPEVTLSDTELQEVWTVT